MSKVLILRPQPGADETATRAAALGLESVVAPIFTVRPLPWQAPDPEHLDAVMLTSANAARHGGTGLAALRELPCYAVGEATAAAARAAGFADVRVGPDDSVALLMTMMAEGIGRALHLCGADHISLEPSEIRITRIPVYVADAVTELPPEARTALDEGAIAVLHSARAARLFGLFAGDRSAISIAAISTRTARAAGSGWHRVAVAPRARDEALLELAAKLCQTARE